MSLESDLKDWLRADAAVSAVVDQRIFRGVAPKGTLRPFMCFYRNSGQSDRTLSGLTGLATARITFDCWAADPEGAEDIAEIVRATIESIAAYVLTYRQPYLLGSTRVRDVVFEGDEENYDETARDFRRMADFTFTFEE